MLFKEVIGQEEIKAKLINSVQTGRIAHAQLFFGPDGSGTLPLALAYAQYIACTNRNETDSCGVCPACRKFSKLAHPDLHFAFPVNTTKSVDKDPVSDNFIKEWREFVLSNPYFLPGQWYDFMGLENKQGLISKNESEAILRKLSFKSFESDYKIMIIWLPEKMNPTAANMLLKLLEEPPEKTIFLLVSEEPNQLLITIASRAQPVKVPPLDAEPLRQKIAEQFSFSEAQLQQITRLANGSYIKVLEVINSSAENEYNLEQFAFIMRSCYGRKFPDINKWVEEMSGIGREKLKIFFNYSIRMIRENFIMNLKTHELNYMTEKEHEFSVRFHPYINGNNVISIYNEMNKACADIERNGYAKIILLDLSLKIIKIIR
jgi:DNA polymerase III subunit delta'